MHLAVLPHEEHTLDPVSQVVGCTGGGIGGGAVDGGQRRTLRLTYTSFSSSSDDEHDEVGGVKEHFSEPFLQLEQEPDDPVMYVSV